MPTREPPATFGVSFLDLICCSLGGVLLLYMLAEPPSDARTDGALKFIQLEVENNLPINLEMSFEANETSYASWQEAAGVNWLHEPGRLTALITFPYTNMKNLGVVALDPDPTDLPVEIRIALRSSEGVSRNFALKRHTLYRWSDK
ncbi:hypothetical protein [Bradyrhizobium sp. AZCC 1708]|uniref:hypothetical protein n=1 Tax=Bradyrhizobium sp. AZCC 1708 TaxID=3117015 RepID=UPI002FEFC81A